MRALLSLVISGHVLLVAGSFWKPLRCRLGWHSVSKVLLIVMRGQTLICHWHEYTRLPSSTVVCLPDPKTGKDLAQHSTVHTSRNPQMGKSHIECMSQGIQASSCDYKMISRNQALRLRYVLAVIISRYKKVTICLWCTSIDVWKVSEMSLIDIRKQIYKWDLGLG